MIFKKASDYLTRIFCEESEGKDFNIYCADSTTTILGGNFGEGDESYYLSVQQNRIGLRINNGKYIFVLSRRPITTVEEFTQIFEDDGEELEEGFKDVEYVECFESDKENGTIVKVEYLVNKSEYLLIGYEDVSKQYSLSVDMLDEFLCPEYFKNIGLDRPSKPDFDITRAQLLFYVPDKYHELYDIEENGSEVESLPSRRGIIQHACADIMLQTDKIWYDLRRDSKDVIFSTKECLIHKYGKDFFDER